VRSRFQEPRVRGTPHQEQARLRIRPRERPVRVGGKRASPSSSKKAVAMITQRGVGLWQKESLLDWRRDSSVCSNVSVRVAKSGERLAKKGEQTHPPIPRKDVMRKKLFGEKIAVIAADSKTTTASARQGKRKKKIRIAQKKTREIQRGGVGEAGGRRKVSDGNDEKVLPCSSRQQLRGLEEDAVGKRGGGCVRGRCAERPLAKRTCVILQTY